MAGVGKRGIRIESGRSLLRWVVPVFLLALAGPGAVAATAAGAEQGDRRLVVSYRAGEVLYDEDQNAAVVPPPALGVQYEQRVPAAAPGVPEISYEGYLACEPSPGARGGVSLKADWLPAGTAGDRRYSLGAALSERPSAVAGRAPERAWDLSAAVQEGRPGGAGFEAGGQVKGYVDRLVGRDYHQASAYLGTRVTFSEPLPDLFRPAGFSSYLDPRWLKGFAALLTPDPEPGGEHYLDLPGWYVREAFLGLPILPESAFPEPGGAAPESRRTKRGRLSVVARHTQTARTYDEGDPDLDWEAGESVVQVRQSAGGKSATASFTDTLKLYPADSGKTYRLQEGELEYVCPAGPAQLRAAGGFRLRTPWTSHGESYRQDRAALGLRLPCGRTASLRVTGDSRWRRHEDDPDRDYLRTAAELEVAGRRCALALSWSARRSLAEAASLGGRRRLGLTAGLPLGAGQQLEGGLAWEQSWGAPEDGVPDAGPVTRVLRLQWSRHF